MFRKKTSPTPLIHLAYLLVCVNFLSACINTTHQPRTVWHDSLPPKQYFVNKYYSLPEAKKITEVDNHLIWIKRFYLGSPLYAKGWLDVTQLVTDSLDNLKLKQRMENRMTTLGKNIATEWALDNSVRKINTHNMVTWGNALLKSIELEQQIKLISLIEKDVALLMDSQLESKQINSERYYATEDYDNF